MLVVKNRGYKRKYIYGGAGMFETISGFLRRLLGSTVAKQVAKQAVSLTLDAGKTAAARAAATAGKKLADRIVNKLTKQPDDLRRKANNVIGKHLSTIGSGNAVANAVANANAIAIQDLVRRTNRSGFKMA